jgi:hypothetical protein
VNAISNGNVIYVPLIKPIVWPFEGWEKNIQYVNVNKLMKTDGQETNLV